MAAFYIPQSVIGMIFFDGYYSTKVFFIAVVSCFVYLFVFHYFFSKNFFSWVNKLSKLNVGVLFFPGVIFTLYIAITIYAFWTTEQIALFEVFKGASIDELSKSRGDFLSTRTGWEAVLPYIHAILKMAFMPYAVATLFFAKHRLRVYFLGVFLLTLALTLEKSSAIVAIMPVVILAINSKAGKGRAVRIVVALIFFIGAVSFLSRGGIAAFSGDNGQIEDGKAATMPVEYQLFVGDSQLYYILNRVFWIPFATAVDWLKYQDEVLGGEYSLGSSIGAVAAILGVPKTNFEKEVFSFQWGQNEDETGTSNTVYFIDAFVNFSWIGVIFYSAVLAVVLRVIVASNNIPAKCAVYVALFYLSFNSLPPILFSGGLIFLLFIMLFLKPVTENASLRVRARQ